MMRFRMRQIEDGDREWVRRFVRDQWSGESIVVHGTVYYPHSLAGFIAEDEKAGPIGLATYIIENAACELVSLDSLRRGEGVGSALVAAVLQEAREHSCSRLWCVTTNDNLPALEFFQKRDFRMVAVHAGAVAQARILKPSIPLLGIENIPIRDEIELEMEIVRESSRVKRTPGLGYR